jgi:hypothetical protein
LTRIVGGQQCGGRIMYYKQTLYMLSTFYVLAL